MELLSKIKSVVQTERDAINALSDMLGPEHEAVAQAILECKGRVVFLGVGKSAHIGKKLAATFASTGTVAGFVHGTEACHGDLGMITAQDLVILISNSGNTVEVTQNIAPLRAIGSKLVAFTAGRESALAKGCDLLLPIPKLPEADDNNLAPTNSSTMTLVLGDALAVAVSSARNFGRQDFYRYHPNGALGAALKKEQV